MDDVEAEMKIGGGRRECWGLRVRGQRVGRWMRQGHEASCACVHV